MLTLSCIKKTEKDEVQLHISYELYRISEIKWSFFCALFESLFPGRFFFQRGVFFGIQVSQLRWTHVAGGRFLSGEGKVVFNFWWVAKNIITFFWWAISPVTPNLRLALLTPFYLSPSTVFSFEKPHGNDIALPPELPRAPFFPPKKTHGSWGNYGGVFLQIGGLKKRGICVSAQLKILLVGRGEAELWRERDCGEGIKVIGSSDLVKRLKTPEKKGKHGHFSKKNQTEKWKNFFSLKHMIVWVNYHNFTTNLKK